MAENKLPNKCDHCGLRVHYSFRSAEEATSSDQVFIQLRTLHEKKIIKPFFRRLVGASNDPNDYGETEFCAISSSAWRKNEKSCSHWQIRMQGASIADYLSIHHDRRNYGAAKWLGIAAIFITITVAILQAVV